MLLYSYILEVFFIIIISKFYFKKKKYDYLVFLEYGRVR